MSDDKKDLWKFPCNFSFKAMTLAIDGIENDIVSAIQKHAPGNYSAKIKPSAAGKYVSVTVKIYPSDKQQLENIYKEVYAVEGVKMLL